MASVSVTNTFSSGTTADASQVNTNFTDITTYINNRNSGSATWDMVSVSHATNVPGTFNNSTGTQDILRCQDNGTNVLVVADGGYVTTANQSACRAYLSGNQAITTGGARKIAFNAETYDVKSEFDSATNYRFTATKAGKYAVMSSIAMNGTGASGASFIMIYVNGAEVAETIYWPVNTPVIGPSFAIADILNLAASDYVEIFVNPAANMTCLGTSAQSWLSISKIA